MIKVVFICLGNICRSPMAQVVFQDEVAKAGLSHVIEIDSAATSSWEEGNPTHPGTRQKLAQVGLSCDGLVSRPLHLNDGQADYLIGMDQTNITDIKQQLGPHIKGQVKRLLDYTDQARDIADPWYTGDFEQTYQDVRLGCQALLAYLIEQEKLS
ncbi:low molecular weight protein-tyrosine-phosphatase [Vaginisenegalia massiliensis]|uniref:low molecular weight protein-tyrosine-phosphatase n=1 Tax=Vaginisenegalia massiliensis TaxID=2058294 RepID=UPI000F537BED|nr:low molecular weight protein-tyrosine-phosphatase [Vaginisenegalia massiliensis]